jgi:hypothetical protein
MTRAGMLAICNDLDITLRPGILISVLFSHFDECEWISAYLSLDPNLLCVDEYQGVFRRFHSKVRRVHVQGQGNIRYHLLQLRLTYTETLGVANEPTIAGYTGMMYIYKIVSRVLIMS